MDSYAYGHYTNEGNTELEEHIRVFILELEEFLSQGEFTELVQHCANIQEEGIESVVAYLFETTTNLLTVHKEQQEKLLSELRSSKSH